MRLITFTLSLTALIFIIPNVGKTQQPLKHRKSIYKAADGKLYANRNLPLYFRVATSDDPDAESYLLMPDEDSKSYANPMYLDTEGYNTFRSPSKVDTVTKKVVYPLSDVIFEIYSDSKAPTTKINFKDKTYYQKDSIYYFGEKFAVEFSTYDATSGLKNTYVSVDGQAYKEMTTPIELNQEKLYNIQYYSVDNVGNAELPNQIYIKLDLTKPVTKLTVEPDLYNDIVSPRSKIILDPIDENSQVKNTVFSINEGTFYNYRKPIVVSGLNEGEHTITYYSVDHAKNEELPKEYTFYLDKTAPMIVDELLGNTFIANGKEYSSGRSKIKLTAMDNKAGVQQIMYSINDGDFIEYTKPFYLSKSGKLKIQTFVTDRVNNQSINTIMTDKSSISYVDLSGPTLGHRFEGANFVSKDTAYITSETKIILASKDDAAGSKRIEYSIDNNEIKEYTQPFSINSDGEHSITYTGYDNVDNSSSKTFICVEDNTGPEIFFRFSINSDKKRTIENKQYDIYPSHVVLFLSSTDNSVGFDNVFYTINGSSKKPYNSLIKGFLKDQLYSINVTAVDKLGNSSEKTIDFYIE